MSIRKVSRRAASAALATILAVVFGCSVALVPNNDPNAGGGGVAPTTLTINIINATGNTLDPEIFVSAGPVSADQLFAAGNKFTAFGVGRLGLIARRDGDSITLDCSQVRVIGTPGGTFGGGTDGNDLTNPAGTGRQIVLTQDLSVFCGGSVTFRYSQSGSGFTTTFTVDP